MNRQTSQIARVSLFEECYNRIKEQIITRQRAHGERISAPEVAEQFGVSRSPVVKALERLEQEGLIEIFPNSGRFVRIPHEKDLVEIGEVRNAFERLALELAMGGDIDLLTKLLLENEAAYQKKIDREGYSSERNWFEYDRRFHEIISECANNSTLKRVRDMIQSQVELFRAHFSEETAREAHRDHKAILAAVERQSKDDAIEALSSHLSSVTLGTLENFHEDTTYESRAARW